MKKKKITVGTELSFCSGDVIITRNGTKFKVLEAEPGTTITIRIFRWYDYLLDFFKRTYYKIKQKGKEGG